MKKWKKAISGKIISLEDIYSRLVHGTRRTWTAKKIESARGAKLAPGDARITNMENKTGHICSYIRRSTRPRLRFTRQPPLGLASDFRFQTGVLTIRGPHKDSKPPRKPAVGALKLVWIESCIVERIGSTPGNLVFWSHPFSFCFSLSLTLLLLLFCILTLPPIFLLPPRRGYGARN